ncbi:hypothetical protein [Pontivivens ytuae]|uniref:Uncharacterized protein n=1 Tax=Pontivivens ytuae TaxID=2789856 RepID=A0A7S9LUJ8_9RHOB|nr:hypothetical protein [Pontivivens ytuae]QPH55020.1 hypothetical protein I0K15_04515 [Pontivivens ytuae]
MTSEFDRKASIARNDAPDLTARRVREAKLPRFIGFEDGQYQCLDCGARAEDMAALEHAPDCPHGA